MIRYLYAFCYNPLRQKQFGQELEKELRSYVELDAEKDLPVNLWAATLAFL